MKINLISVGTRMPPWVEAGVAEYRKRLPRDFELRVTEVPLAPRGRNADLARALAREGEACLKALDRDTYVIALAVEGKVQDTESMAAALGRLRDTGRGDIALLVGGPDGLAPACRSRADASWSLSALTLPHPLVRVLLVEQVYRAWTILTGHPYHRA